MKSPRSFDSPIDWLHTSPIEAALGKYTPAPLPAKNKPLPQSPRGQCRVGPDTSIRKRMRAAKRGMPVGVPKDKANG